MGQPLDNVKSFIFFFFERTRREEGKRSLIDVRTSLKRDQDKWFSRYTMPTKTPQPQRKGAYEAPGNLWDRNHLGDDLRDIFKSAHKESSILKVVRRAKIRGLPADLVPSLRRPT